MSRTIRLLVSRSLRPSAVAGAAAWIALTACRDDATSPMLLSPGDIQGALTNEAASALGPDGRFIQPAPPPEPYPQMSTSEAAEVAAAWARTYGKYVRDEFERIHGKPINFEALRVGPEPYYARAVYEAVAPDVHAGIRNAFGPQYLVYLVDDEGPVVSIAVAAFSGARVENGRLDLSGTGGMELVPSPVRRGDGFAVPVSPEQAASLASRASGAKVARAPELLMPPKGYHPQFSRWRVSLDRDVASGSGGRTTREVFVELRGRLATSAQAQPEEASVYDPSTKRTVPLVRRAGQPVSFERAQFLNR